MPYENQSPWNLSSLLIDEYKWRTLANKEHWMTLSYCLCSVPTEYQHTKNYWPIWTFISIQECKCILRILNNAMYFYQPIPVARIFAFPFIMFLKKAPFFAFYSMFCIPFVQTANDSIHVVLCTQGRKMCTILSTTVLAFFLRWLCN